MKKLAKAAYRIEGQPMFKLLARVQEFEREGKDIIHFEIGDPDFATPENVIEAAVSSLRSGETHYTSSMGLTDFRIAAAEATYASRGFRPSLDQVLITPGANIVIYYAIRCLVDPGEEVMIPDPCFPTYLSTIRLCDVKAVKVPLREENEFRLNPKDVRDRITENTRLIIINSPQNPTGSVMTREEMDEIFNIAEENDVYLLSDEMYVRMIYDMDTPFYSPAMRDHCTERTLVLNGFSKTFAMTGWRLGCVIGPEPVIDKMGLFLQTTSSCVSPFVQRAGIEAIKGPQDDVKAMIREYKARRDILVDGLNRLPGVRCVRPGGAFYVFPHIAGTGMDDETFSRVMLEEAHVALLPGTNFGEAGAGFVRLCYATSRAHIVEGLKRMGRYLKERRVP